MTHQIERNDHYVGGESAVWEFTVKGEDEPFKTLTDGEVEWYLLDGRNEPDSDAILDHEDSAIDARIEDGENGVVVVEIESGATEEYAGSLKWHRLVVEDSSGSTQIWNGRFPIQER